jgi:murein DD-endopeptidase MepM/ murein hydrolase activator NlpD
MEGLVASGDTTTNNNNQHYGDIYNTYGSGDKSQRAYGSYMNMSERGCGPVALADAYARRSGKSIDAGSLAYGMSQSGAYDQNRGTSVGGFTSTSKALGMNLTAGGVTAQSLKHASPTNPITIVGSGSDYGTRKGNNHYMNVVGTDKYGGAYVSNPLTGRVDRKPLSTVASSSILGLYGSGDSDNLITFSDEVTSAMSELKSVANNLLSIFSTDSSSDDELQSIANDQGTDNAIDSAKKLLGDKYDEFVAKARAAIEKKYPKRDGESDDEYEERISPYVEKETLRLVSESGELEDAGNSKYSNLLNVGKDAAMTLYGYDTETGETTGTGLAGKVTADAAAASSYVDSQNGGNDGSFVSDDGVELATSSYTPTIFDVDIDGSASVGTMSHAPLYEFFAKTSGADAAWSEDGNWFLRRNDPDQYGQGSSGSTHMGVDIHMTNDDDGKLPLYATTDGTVTLVQGGITREGVATDNGGAGNYIVWEDNMGHTHRYLHLANSVFDLAVGDKVTGGVTKMGYLGNTGDSTGAHLHYDIDRGTANYNPIKFFSNYVSSSSGSGQGKITLPDTVKNKSAWDAYKDNDGVKPFITNAETVGMSPAQIATIMSTGIWEDSGQKIFGNKSLTEVVTDGNGQVAKGIMNWVDTSVDYGSTLGDQLRYIEDAYFSSNPSHERGRAVDAYRSGYSWGTVFERLMGYKPDNVSVGDPLGPAIDKELIEGSSYFYGGALVPACFLQDEGFKYVATAVDAYNWMLDNGYATESSDNGTSSSSSSSKSSSSKSSSSKSSSSKSSSSKSSDTIPELTGNTTEAQLFNQLKKYGFSDAGAAGIMGNWQQESGLRPNNLEDWFAKNGQYELPGGYTDESYTEAVNNDTYKYFSNDLTLLKQKKPVIYTHLIASHPDYATAGGVGYGIAQWTASDRKKGLLNYAKANDRSVGDLGAQVGYFMNEMEDAKYTSLLQNLQTTDSPTSAADKFRSQFEGTGNASNERKNYANTIYNRYATKTTTTGTASNQNDRSKYQTTTTTAPVETYNNKNGGNGLRGSGDVPSDYDNDLLYRSLNGLGDDTTFEIPPLDESLISSNSSYDDSGYTPTIINNYEIKPDDSVKIEYLNKILTNTYSVRAERIEELLETIIEKMDDDKSDIDTTNTSSTPKLFNDDSIPSQVTRLSRG